MKKSKEQDLQEKTQHGTLHFPMDVYWNDFKKYVAQIIPWHWHEELEFVVIISGKVLISVGNNNLELKSGEGIFINSNVLHQMIPTGEEETFMFTIVMHPGLLGIEKGYLLGTRYVMPYIQNDTLKFQSFSPEVFWQKGVLERLAEVYEINHEKTFAYEYALHNKMCDIWLILLQNLWKDQKENKEVPSIDEGRIYQALQYIHSNYAENITLDDICEYISVSKSECCRCFQRNLQTTPFEYLMLHRIGAAAKLLEETNESITSVALMTGFNSNSYFGKQFRKYMNLSPNEYRKSAREKEEGARKYETISKKVTNPV